MERERKVFLSEMAMFILAMIWGGTFVAGKFALETIPAEWILVLRFLVSALVMAVMFWKEWKKCDAYTVKTGVFIGFLLFFGISIQMVGLKYTTPAKQSFLVVSYVILVPIVHYVMNGVKPERKVFYAGILCLMGVGLLSLNEELSLEIGDGLTLLYALIFSVQLVFVAGFVPKVKSPMIFTIVQLFAAGVFALITVLFTKTPLPRGSLTGPPLFGLFYLTFLNTAVAYALQNVAQRYARPANTALIMATESVFGAICAILFVNETFDTRKALGCALIFIAILAAQFDRKTLASMFRKRDAVEKRV